MKYQFLPYYFKWIAIILYVIFGLLPNFQHFVNGFSGNPSDTRNLGIPTIFFSQTFNIIQYVAILIYALSKDKVFDEFMIKIRLESMYMIFFATLVFILAKIIISNEWEMSAALLFEIQVVSFLILNKIRKNLLMDSV
ncbi:MAG: hypothetical protein AAFN93_05365 [Bacteroidota bacterium]